MSSIAELLSALESPASDGGSVALFGLQALNEQLLMAGMQGMGGHGHPGGMGQGLAAALAAEGVPIAALLDRIGHVLAIATVCIRDGTPGLYAEIPLLCMRVCMHILEADADAHGHAYGRGHARTHTHALMARPKLLTAMHALLGCLPDMETGGAVIKLMHMIASRGFGVSVLRARLPFAALAHAHTQTHTRSHVHTGVHDEERAAYASVLHAAQDFHNREDASLLLDVVPDMVRTCAAHAAFMLSQAQAPKPMLSRADTPEHTFKRAAGDAGTALPDPFAALARRAAELCVDTTTPPPEAETAEVALRACARVCTHLTGQAFGVLHELEKDKTRRREQQLTSEASEATPATRDGEATSGKLTVGVSVHKAGTTPDSEHTLTMAHEWVVSDAGGVVPRGLPRVPGHVHATDVPLPVWPLQAVAHLLRQHVHEALLLPLAAFAALHCEVGGDEEAPGPRKPLPGTRSVTITCVRAALRALTRLVGVHPDLSKELVERLHVLCIVRALLDFFRNADADELDASLNTLSSATAGLLPPTELTSSPGEAVDDLLMLLRALVQAGMAPLAGQGTR